MKPTCLLIIGLAFARASLVVEASNLKPRSVSVDGANSKMVGNGKSSFFSRLIFKGRSDRSSSYNGTEKSTEAINQSRPKSNTVTGCTTCPTFHEELSAIEEGENSGLDCGHASDDELEGHSGGRNTLTVEAVTDAIAACSVSNKEVAKNETRFSPVPESRTISGRFSPLSFRRDPLNDNTLSSRTASCTTHVTRPVSSRNGGMALVTSRTTITSSSGTGTGTGTSERRNWLSKHTLKFYPTGQQVKVPFDYKLTKDWLPRPLETGLYPDYGYYARELLYRLFEKEEYMPWSTGELAVGFELMCKVMRNPHNPTQRYAAYIEDIVSNEPYFTAFIDELFSVKREVVAEVQKQQNLSQLDMNRVVPFSPEHLTYALKTLICPLIGKYCNQVDLASGVEADIVVTSIAENVAVVTPRDIFFHPGLARVAALLLERYDQSILWYIFEKVVTVHLAGMWGPTLEEMGFIAPYKLLPGAPPRAQMEIANAEGDVFGPFEALVEERLIDTKAFREYRAAHGGIAPAMRSWQGLHSEAVSLARDYVEALPLNGRKKSALESLEMVAQSQSVKEEIRSFFGSAFTVGQQLDIMHWLLFVASRKMGEDRFAPILIAAYYWTVVQKQTVPGLQGRMLIVNEEDYPLFKKALNDIAQWEKARVLEAKRQQRRLKTSKRAERSADSQSQSLAAAREKTERHDIATAVMEQTMEGFEDIWDKDVGSDAGSSDERADWDCEDENLASTSSDSTAQSSEGQKINVSLSSGADSDYDSEGFHDMGKGLEEYRLELNRARDDFIQSSSLRRSFAEVDEVIK
jgi:hypothetical protein